MQLIKNDLKNYEGLQINPYVKEVYQVVDESQECGFVFIELFDNSLAFHIFMLPSRRSFKKAFNLIKMLEYLTFEMKGLTYLYTLATPVMQKGLERRQLMRAVRPHQKYMLMVKTRSDYLCQ